MIRKKFAWFQASVLVLVKSSFMELDGYFYTFLINTKMSSQ